MKRVALGGAATPSPVYGFTYAYTLPSGLLTLWETSIDGANIPWTREQDALFTDATDVSILYSYRIEPVTEWAPGFRHTVELALAADLAVPVMRDRDARAQYEQDALAALLDALTTEGQQETPPIINNFTLIQPRFVNGAATMPLSGDFTTAFP